ncbi:MAG: hypothetical protein WEB00_02775 [Dehalococcoidia bacterium]
MSFITKRTVGGALAVMAIFASFLAFGSSVSAGDDDVGFDGGNITCFKTAFSPDPDFSDAGAELGEEIRFEVTCVVDELATDASAGIVDDTLTIIDVVPGSFVIEDAFCLTTGTIEAFSGVPNFSASISGNTVACQATPLVVGASVTLVVIGHFPFGPCGTIKNVATAEYAGDEETPAEFIFVECSDIAVTKTAATVTDPTGAHVAQGGTIVYTITVCNLSDGFGEAQFVFLFDQLPLGAEFQSAASADFALTFDGTSSQILATTDSLQPGECGVIIITVDTADDAPCGTPFTNTAVGGHSVLASDITGSNFVGGAEATFTNNTATVTTVVFCDTTPGGGGGGGGGGGPAVGTGDTGFLAEESSLAGWQLGLLSLVIVASMSGAVFSYRKTR